MWGRGEVCTAWTLDLHGISNSQAVVTAASSRQCDLGLALLPCPPRAARTCSGRPGRQGDPCTVQSRHGGREVLPPTWSQSISQPTWEVSKRPGRPLFHCRGNKIREVKRATHGHQPLGARVRIQPRLLALDPALLLSYVPISVLK